MALSTRDFRVLDTIAGQDITSQRQLSQYTGISLGQINYMIRRLLEKGLIKVGNFRRQPRKIGYAYLLTPKGLEAKSKLAVRFALNKLNEYNEICKRLAERLTDVERRGFRSVAFVGPGVVRDLIASIIKDTGIEVRVTHHFSSVDQFTEISNIDVDAVLFFDDQIGSISDLPSPPGIDSERLILLW